MGCRKSSSKREFIAIQPYLMKQEKTSNRQPNFIPKTTGKRRTKKKKQNPKLVEGKKS